MAALAPEAGDGLPDRGVVAARVPVHVAGVRELGDGGRGHEVDLGVRERLERGQGELLGQGVDLGVLEELAARLVQGRGRGVRFEGAGRELVREVLARVEVFEEARGRFEIVVLEVDGAVLFFAKKKAGLVSKSGWEFIGWKGKPFWGGGGKGGRADSLGRRSRAQWRRRRRAI